MSSVKFQYFSDIHLEFYNENTSKVKRIFDIKSSPADVLLLAGDIGKPNMQTYSLFLNLLSPTFDKICITTGNHEYYKMPMSMTEVDNMCREVCRNLPHQNVSFLQNEYFALNEYIDVYGGTFWTHTPADKEQYVMSKINDYKYIYNFSPSISNSLHSTATKSLEDYIMNKNSLKKTIVLSHHMPSFHLIDPCYRCLDNDLNYAFASNITCARDQSIVAWVYGHTHKPYADGKFYCNPIGYPNENKQWTLERFFDITNCTL
jgi:predicted phosphohydrolase